jgi:quinol monooxygenase YgiN
VTPEPLVLVVGFQARVGAGRTLGERLQGMAWSSLREPGCLEYSVHVDLDDPDRYVLYERWADQAALDRHDGAAHVREFVATFAELLATPIEKRRLRRSG